MRSVPWRRAPRRGARFERFEDRIVLSAIPGTDGWYAQTPDLVNPLPDWQDTAPAVAPLAVDAAAHSDAAYVRDTYGFEGIGQTVAIIDSGIAYWHEAFGGGFGTGHVVVGGWDFSERDADPHDDGPAGFHGTHVAGIIGSRCGVHTGVAPGVDLVALRVFNDMGLGYSSWVEEALRWVHNHRNDFRYPITTVNMSLGAKWNGAAPPSWGILEDELATLRADGIFVAVAAGNSFAQYGLPGLAYPAASPHVVPVASVDAAGALSGFSQRLGRVLAAPGEKITSTVPDHVFGADGVHNDWAAVSGTSMAAPYVAGASVLVREAMQLAGYTAIDQGVIYAHLRDTADLVFDPATGTTYHRVNLSAAIDALMPADDYGSCPADAFDLGMLTDTWTVSGRIDRLDDRDFFQFTAAANGVVTLTLPPTATTDVTVLSDVWVLESGGERIRFEVTAGSTTVFSVNNVGRLCDYRLELQLDRTNGIRVEGGVAHVEGTPGDDVIELTVGSLYEVVVNGQVHTLSRGAARAFEISGSGGCDTLILHGTPGSDAVVLHAGRVTMTGEGYEVRGAGFSRIVVHAGDGGDDVATFHDTYGDDEFLSLPSESSLKGRGFENRAVGFDRVVAYASLGDDVARFHGSAGSDEYVGGPGESVMRGDGYWVRAVGFDRAHADAGSGGDDVARLFDSAGDDLFVFTPGASSLRGSGYFHKVTGFDRTFAHASGNANDVARFFDSPGNDVFEGDATACSITAAGSFGKAQGFAQVVAYAGFGRDDVAQLRGTPGHDPSSGRGHTSIVQAAGTFIKVVNFDRVVVLASAAAEPVFGAALERDARFFAPAGGQTAGGTGDSASDHAVDHRPSVSRDELRCSWLAAADGACGASSTASIDRTAGRDVRLRRISPANADNDPTIKDAALLQLGDHSWDLFADAARGGDLPVPTRHDAREFSEAVLDELCDPLTALYLSATDGLLDGWGGERPE